MIGTTLSDIREHIESLASESGRYYLACARFGDRPVPADDLTFRSRAVARAAARATEQYHATLRRYDPHAPYYDVIVCEDHPDPTAPSDGPSTLDGERPAADDTALSGPATDELIDVCHTVAGVVFEAIANSSHVGLENAVMETYLSTAETIEDPTELCLRLLAAIATELDERLNPAAQASLLGAAADSLPETAFGPAGGERPLAGVLDDMQAAGLLEGYRLQPQSTACGDAWRVRLEGYALGRENRVVTLPIVVTLFDRLSTRTVTITDAQRAGDGEWQVTLRTSETATPEGLACAHA